MTWYTQWSTIFTEKNKVKKCNEHACNLSDKKSMLYTTCLLILTAIEDMHICILRTSSGVSYGIDSTASYIKRYILI